SSINWLNQPPRVRLVVRTAESITPRQVELLQEFITKEMGRPFQLNVLVSKVNEVTSPE
ncbi:MAG: TIGR00341 family protein, partial [Microcystis sp.]